MRNINKDEKRVLINQKMIEGNSEENAIKEVQETYNFIKNFKNIIKEKKKEVKDLEKLKIRLKKEIEKLRNKLESEKVVKPRKEPKGDIKESERYKFANINHIRKVHTYLKEFPESNVTVIARDLRVSKNLMKDSIHLLCKLDVCDKIDENGTCIYFLKNQIIS